MNVASHVGRMISGDVVRGCTVQDITGTSGADVWGISGSVIEGNVVIDVGGASRSGIVSGGYQARIANNSLTRCKLVANAVSEVTGNRVGVDNNQVALEVTSYGSRISGNTVRAGTGSTARGILVTGFGNFIERNVVNVGASAFGIYVTNKKNTIAQNTVHGESGDGIELVSGANNCHVDGNTVYGVTGTGIAVLAPTTNNSIVRNTVIGISGSPYLIAVGNQFGVLSTGDTLDATVGAWANLAQP